MNDVLMEYCPICKRYFPVKKFRQHLAKHKGREKHVDI